MKSIQQYTRYVYAFINNRLRAEESTQEDLQLISDIRENCECSYGVVYRGTRNYVWELKKGDVFKDKGILSASREKAVAMSYISSFGKQRKNERTLFIMHGCSYDISSYSENKEEQEEVFLPETEFKVLDVYYRWGTKIVHVLEKGCEIHPIIRILNKRVF